MSAERKNNNRKYHRGRRKKKKTSDIVSKIVLVVALVVFFFSLFQLVRTLVPYYSGGKEYEDVKNLAITISEDKEDGDGFQIDFQALQEANPDTIAWIRFDEPQIISYPVVKSADNNEYLTKTFTANDNKLGAIFMDMRNNTGFTDRNTFIYGHNLKVGGEMFSQLNTYAEEAFCKEHPYFYIYTPDGQKRTYQVFFAGVVKDDSDHYTLTFATEDAFKQYLQMCKDTSNYQVDVPLDETSKIVSLSTCTNVNEDERFLVQGVLVNQEEHK